MNELANLDTYLISKHWGVPKCKEKIWIKNTVIIF